MNFLTKSIPVAGLILLTACGGDSDKKAAPPKPIQSIVFLDKSTSAGGGFTEFALQKYNRTLKNLVATNIRSKGDRLDIYYIHENTIKAEAFSGTSQAAVSEDTTDMNPTDKEAIVNDFELTLRKERTEFQNQALKHLLTENATATNQQTDIWGTLEVVKRIADTSSIVNVYYLSDMIESAKGTNRRDFHTTPPQTREQATEWAKTDAAVLKKDYGSIPYDKITIHFVLPFEPTSTSKENNPNVTYYWETLFELLGYKKRVEEIN
ncbi:hypothetical protein [Xanthocytophaga flava]|uniref:hypothetical protein n=1 Tax=Xanthocytophaga flava TaxID=3048013 RepID=UPI0028D4D295|nr:hypothetical protein [Xanthocytophaga flavus]MDJ1473207.1 hypothetical protein [Xanthocytophaga flavus]